MVEERLSPTKVPTEPLAVIFTFSKPIFWIVAPFVAPKSPTRDFVLSLMYRLEIVCPKPSNLPVKRFQSTPIGFQPLLLFHPEVTLASILLP